MAGNSGVINSGAGRSRPSTVRVEHGVFGSQNRQINRTTRCVGYMLVIEPDEFRIQQREDRRMDGIEGFVRHFGNYGGCRIPSSSRSEIIYV